MIIINGKTEYVPDVYGVIKVTNLGSVNLPNFNLGLLIGKQLHGIPFNAGSPENGSTLIKGYSNVQALMKDYGGYGELITGFRRAKKSGAGIVFVLGANPLTRALATLPDSNAAGSVVLHPKAWGVSGNDISIAIVLLSTVTTITMTPPKNVKMLTADSGTGTSIKVDDVSGLAVGDTVYLTDNVYAVPVAKVIKEIVALTSGYQITFTEVIAASAVIASWAHIFQEDTANQAVKSFSADDYTLTNTLAWISQQEFISATIATSALLPPNVIAKTYLGLISAATKGTSPIATETLAGTWDTIIDAVPQLMEEFALANKLRIRIVCPLTSNSGSHAGFSDMAVSLRENGSAIKVIVGSADGDIDLESNSAHPKKRAYALNSDDVIFAGDGHDDLAAYLSHAPEILGFMVANSPNHNLTRDTFNISRTEKFFGKNNKDEVAGYLRSGVMITGTSPKGFHVVQGINTYQDQNQIWNDATAKTYLIFNRHMADFVNAGIIEQLDTLVGADNVTIESAGRIATAILENYMTNGFIPNYRVVSVTKRSNSYLVKVNIDQPDVVDFVGSELNIIVPE